MVFEALVASILNKYLGEFVVNLDKSQLNIGIWGGELIIVIYRIDFIITAAETVIIKWILEIFQ